MVPICMIWRRNGQVGANHGFVQGLPFTKYTIPLAIYFYLRDSVSLGNLEEFLAERGVYVDHATLRRWVVKFSPL